MNIGTWLVTDAQGNIRTSDQGLDLIATGLNEVLQNVMIIITTRIGSVMGDRRFGLAYNFLDAPQNVFENLIVQQLCIGLAFFEPRAKFSRIQFAPSFDNPGEMDVQLEVKITSSELLVRSQ